MASGTIISDYYPNQDVTITLTTPTPTGVEWNTSAAGVFANRSGHVVQIRIVDLDITSELSEWTTIATGLPVLSGNLYSTSTDFSNVNGATELNFRVNTSGQLAVRRGTAGKRYLTTIVYLATSL